MKGSSTSPPAFSWDDWYSSVGGRSIHIAEVDFILQQIREYQYPKFKGEVNPQQTVFETTDLASTSIKKMAFELGADEVGVAEIEPATAHVFRARAL